MKAILWVTLSFMFFATGYFLGASRQRVSTPTVSSVVLRDTIREVRRDTIYVPREVVRYRIVKEPAEGALPCVERLEARGPSDIVLETETFLPTDSAVVRMRETLRVPLPDRFFGEAEVAVRPHDARFTVRVGRTFRNRTGAAFLSVDASSALGLGVGGGVRIMF